MYALTIQDLQTALNASERSNQTLVDLQIDRALLRLLLTGAIQNENAQKLYASAQRSNGLFELIDCEPLQSSADELPVQAETNLGAHNRFFELIRESVARKNKPQDK